MKNQYFGDLNDYRKYGLLRVLTRMTGLRIGVCWMLTDDDERTDGQLRRYLEHPDRWRSFDQDLYDKLRPFGRSRGGAIRTVPRMELIPNATYFDDYLHDNMSSRERYFRAAWKRLGECPVIFFDPDNGIEVSSISIGRRGSAKYLYWREIEHAFANGHSLIIYQHYPRVSRDRFVSGLCTGIGHRIGAARVSALCTPRVAFFLVQQPAHVEALNTSAKQVSDQWFGQVDVWPAS